MRDQLSGDFHRHYGRRPELVVRSPGRVNLIGDHTDYNDGFVMPIAIEQATWLAAARRADRIVHLVSDEFGAAELDLDHLAPSGTWVDYVAGTLREIGVSAPGFDAVVHSTLPIGAGLSSSAALELGVARLAVELSGGTWDPKEGALAGTRAENDFVGMPCGVMDQLIVACGAPDTALLLDCRSLETRHVPLPGSATVVILDTGTRRRLVASSYQERRSACAQAAALLGVPALRDASLELLEAHRPDSSLYRRARHVITENARTCAAADALVQGDAEAFGRLMDASHASLRDDFEVSSPALDAITEIARAQPGCYGARLTGGGFAGCGVALVATNTLDAFIAGVGEAYDASTGQTAGLYPTSAAGGVSLA